MPKTPRQAAYEPILAVIEVVPLSSPMVIRTGTCLRVPAKLAFRALAWNEYRKAPVGAIRTTRLTPSISAWKVNGPNPVPWKDPGGMVVEKVPT